MDNAHCCDVTVLELRPVGQSERPGEFYELRLTNPGWKRWHPGQFVMLRPVSWGLEPLWGRPFSICGVDDEALTVFFQAIGRGTRRLAELAEGDKVTVWGPLGTYFAVEPDTPTLMLAGGIGIAPFRGYVERHPNPANLRLFLAHRMPLGCYPYDRFAGERAECLRELNPKDLEAIIARLRALVEEYREGLILCCGPTPFMRTVRNFALEFGARAQLSLENRMACGVGACLGCVAKDGEGHHVQTCLRGPVLWADAVQL